MSDLCLKNNRVLFVVLFRTGGTKQCMWKRMHGAVNFKTAEKHANDLEMQGYKSLVTPLDYFEDIGMPVGWDAESVDWQNDRIEYRLNETFWKSCRA
jgi:hypothetical protein